MAAAIAAGCSGGSTTAPSAPATSGTVNQASLIAVPGSAGTVTLPAVGGVTPAFGIAAGAPAGLTISTTESTVAPTASTARKADDATSSGFLYITATFSVNVAAGIFTSEMLTLSSSLPQNVGYSCTITDITGATPTTVGAYGPVVPSNGSVTIPNGTSSPAFTAGHTYVFAFSYSALASPTPSPSAGPTSSGAAPSPTPTATASGTATAPPLFSLSGATATAGPVTPPAAPGPLVLPASGGYGTYGAHVTLQFGSETASAPFVLSAGLGSTANDINPAGSFPFYTGATPLFYLALSSTATVTFAQTPAVTVTVSSLPNSNSCSLYIYANTGGSAYQWVQVPGTIVNASGSTVTIPAANPPSGVTLNLAPNQTQLGFVGC